MGLWAMLIGIIAISPGLGLLIRRRRTDMPRVVARNYGGTVAVCAVSAVLLGAGLIHHASVTAARHALQVADARARVWIARQRPRRISATFRHA